LFRFSQIPPQQIFTHQNSQLSFNHAYRPLNNTSNTIQNHVINFNPAIAHTVNSIIGDSNISINYNFNAGTYEFEFVDLIGEVQNAELKIDYPNPKTHLGINNGHTHARFNLNPLNPVIPANPAPLLAVPNTNLIIPLNGWENSFSIVPSREQQTATINMNYDGQLIQGRAIIGETNQVEFQKLDFTIMHNQIRYNNSKSNIGFIFNLYVCDSSFNPIQVYYNLGRATTKRGLSTRIIHSIDIHSGQANTQSLFLFGPADPLAHPITVPLNAIIQAPNTKNKEIIELSLSFQNNSPLPMPYVPGFYYVLAEIKPVHFAINGANAEIDSIDCAHHALYRIKIR
jgi:hypothetical protein